ncbi:MULTISPECIES: 2Fe-2S iron-sulfur cluster-binding protein [Photorhabdus]|uniref:2Fe-2S iron-sulfur cluster binding domain-containing protein n=2 Tax=Photorhabdus TaxID=29487 RepID=A0ABX0B6M5_9GAMM|nr:MULTISPECIES: 2Fe-2S iron-sulfur cluster binding domain-containing protein [Photorhabdus]MCC8374807.1 2Fe-2S iron-sulfur cluster binding domain-containing protein [Photorhabdus bodei]MCT8352843.1 2Fe-2S iron-sulfur cluster binding domain-containing protein [Photorhabdus kayaii]MDB6369656.1 2Fe-2S iron-sulfur cluster binding domain-containing protein [Photorhabdus bodei]MDB6373912.1 2Fe-2S iron-sulfur cluster binding domain-containing protein [Photorhabdus bodei]NDL12934.1 2Fe-2S iron-sulfur
MSFKAKPDGHRVILDGADVGNFCPETSLLENFDKYNIDIPSLCRAGKCGCCKMMLIKGQVRHGKQSALSEDELEENIILACCAYSESDIEIELY